MTQIIDFTADGGATWQRVANFTDTDVHTPLQAYDGTDTYVIMCSTTASGNDGIFKSTDDGVSFARVTGITGLDFANDIFYKCEYGLSKLWLVAEAEFGEDGELFSSSDDGSTWSTELLSAGFLITFAISGSGIMYAGTDSVKGAFDADGVSLPAMGTDLFGQPAGWAPFANGGSGGTGTYLYADSTSRMPNRFFAALYHFTADEARIIYSDDNGTTWKLAKLALNSAGFPMTTATGCQFLWDGTNYHFLVSGATDYWFWSRDGSVWTEAPAGSNAGLTSFPSSLPHRSVAAANKDA